MKKILFWLSLLMFLFSGPLVVMGIACHNRAIGLTGMIFLFLANALGLFIDGDFKGINDNR